jgi:predicted small metal-binding protein
MKAAYEAAKAKSEAENSKRNEKHAKKKLGEQTICVFLTIDEGI